MTEFKVGDKVVFAGSETRYLCDELGLVPGDIGVITYPPDGADPKAEKDGAIVKWVRTGNEVRTMFKEMRLFRTLAEKRQDDYRILARASEPWRNPDHYQFPGGVQVIDITRHLSFPLGNVIKYCSRAGKKGPKVEDLQKALKYLEWAIEDAKKESE